MPWSLRKGVIRGCEAVQRISPWKMPWSLRKEYKEVIRGCEAVHAANFALENLEFSPAKLRQDLPFYGLSLVVFFAFFSSMQGSV